MKVANGVEMLEISANVMGRQSVIYPTLIWDNDTMILVDSGFPGQLPLISEAIEKAGIPFEKLKMLIITHHDIDHIGGALGIKKELTDKVKIMAHEIEKPYINGEKTPLKLAHIEANFNSLPEEMKSFYEKFKAGFQNSIVDIDKTLVDGEILPCCGGVTIVFTPGHTLGHICLYLNESKILIAGDLLNIEAGKLISAKPSINFDIKMSKRSINKLANYDIEAVICYHGGLYKDNVNERIRELANE